ncbi:MAG: hypothetical protein WA110_03390 [Anaerolineaceae bacterium]
MLQASRSAQSLDHIRLVTNGNPLTWGNLLFPTAPAVNQYSAVWEEASQPPCYARVVHQVGEPNGQLTFLVAEPESDSGAVTCLLEDLIRHSGTWGARYLLCDLPTDSAFLPAFRRADFNIWARQRLFRFIGTLPRPLSMAYAWRPWNSGDIKAMLSLYRNLVPKLFQSIEPLTRKAMLGLVLTDQKNNLLGYADLEYGMRGIWVLPFLLPEANDPQILLDMLASLPATFQRPVYICARSYQPWMEDVVSHLPVESGGEQALMVRYLVLQEKVPQAVQRQVFETNPSDGSVPVAQAHHNGNS